MNNDYYAGLKSYRKIAVLKELSKLKKEERFEESKQLLREKLFLFDDWAKPGQLDYNYNTVEYYNVERAHKHLKECIDKFAKDKSFVPISHCDESDNKSLADTISQDIIDELKDKCEIKGL